jgi:hypothetical protein
MTPVVIVAKSNKNAKTASVKDCTLYSTKNHLKLQGKYSLTLDQAIT